eukprot:snap_masked-scaffold_63-processed-gene-0.51-mRNA-1 protein AED:1.00 eAED:1.00 QI:0/-1/0/0/-1/1/1/0/318
MERQFRRKASNSPGTEAMTNHSSLITDAFFAGGSMLLRGSPLKMQKGYGSGTISVQYKGYLQKKPFYKGTSIAPRANMLSKWSTKYFVLKDSFLFWYKKQPHDGSANFSMFPSGCVPLAGATVIEDGKKNNGYLFSIKHDEFGGKSLVLKADDLNTANAWIKHIRVSSSASWEKVNDKNVKVMMLQKDEAKDGRKLEVYQRELQQNYEKEEQTAKERQMFMEDQIREKRMAQKELKKLKRGNVKKDKSVEQSKRELQKVEEELEEEEYTKNLLQEKLKRAKSAVEALQLTVLEKKGPNKRSLLADIDKLRKLLNEGTF